MDKYSNSGYRFHNQITMKYLKLFESLQIPDDLLDNYQELEDEGLDMKWTKIDWFNKEVLYLLDIKNITKTLFERIIGLEERLQSYKLALIPYTIISRYHSNIGGKFIQFANNFRQNEDDDIVESINNIRDLFDKESIMTKIPDKEVWKSEGVSKISFLFKKSI